MVADVLRQCVEKNYVGAVMFRELLALRETEQNYPSPPTGKIVLMDTKNNKKADIQPDKSDLNTYQKAFEE